MEIHLLITSPYNNSCTVAAPVLAIGTLLLSSSDLDLVSLSKFGVSRTRYTKVTQ